jgi:hypothetical protein
MPPPGIPFMTFIRITKRTLTSDEIAEAHRRFETEVIEASLIACVLQIV